MIRSALPLLCVMMFQGGCYLELPLGGDRGSYPALAGENGSAPALRPGETTRAGVVARLGPPTWRWDDEAVWEYVEHPPKSFHWFFPMLIGHGSPMGVEDGTHYLMLRFGPGDLLNNYEVLLHPSDSEHEVELRWFRAGDGARSPATTRATWLKYAQRHTYGPPSSSPRPGGADVDR